MHLYLWRITLGCYQCVDIVHLLFIVSGRQKKKIHSQQWIFTWRYDPILQWKKIVGCLDKVDFHNRAPQSIKNHSTYGCFTSLVWCRVINVKWWNMPLTISLIHRWIMVATRRYKSHLLGDKLEMGSAVSNGLGNQKKSWTKTQNMHWQ